MNATASEAIATYALRRRDDAVSPATTTAVARAFVDTYGVAIAGGADPVRTVAAAVVGTSSGAARDWSSGERYRSDDAAFVNGISGHILDFDDVTSPLRGHPSVVAIPALVALAEDVGATGSQLAHAYETGFEVTVRLSRALIASHYVNGWHSTATIGLVGAAVAGAQLLRLDEAGIVNAIGLAVASAAGTRQNFGSLAKSFQAGNAAAAAVRAARLAEAGMDASPAALDGTLGGFVGLYTQADEADLAAELATIGAPPGELATSGLEVKKYPLCYATHRALDGLLDLRDEYGLNLDSVAKVTVRTNNGGLVPLIHHRPQTGLEAKFSMEFAVAAALKFGSVRLATFRDEVVQSPDVQDFFAKVDAAETDGPMFPRWTEVTVDRTDGTVLTKRIETLRGGAQTPLSVAELTAKVTDCFAFAGRNADAAAFVEAALDWKDAPIRDVLDVAEN